MPWERTGEDARSRATELPVSTPRGRIHTLEADNTQHPSLVLSYDPPTAPTLLTSSDMRLSMAPSMECSAPREAQNTGSGLAWGCWCHP